MNNTERLANESDLPPGINRSIRLGDVATSRVVAYQLDENRHPQSVVNHDVEAEVHEGFSAIKKTLVEGLSSHEEGVDISGIRSYLETLGLQPTADVYVLDKDDYDVLLDRMAQVGAAPESAGGFFLPGYNMVVAYRNAELEAEFGPAYTEYAVAHELAHAAITPTLLVDMPADGSEAELHLGRTGFGVSRITPELEIKGRYLEEAFADTVAWRYIDEKYGKADGFASNVQSQPSYIEVDTDLIAAPAMLMIGEKQNIAAIASMGLKLLTDKDPTLFNSMIASRSDTSRLRDVIQKINAIGDKVGYPGLYKMIRDSNEGASGYAEMTRNIAEVVDPDLAAEWNELYSEEAEDGEYEESTSSNGPTVAEQLEMKMVWLEETERSLRDIAGKVDDVSAARRASLEDDLAYLKSEISSLESELDETVLV